LLPGTAGCLTVVTSRNQLTGLVAADAAVPLELDLPSADEARQMLTARLGLQRVTAEPEAVDDIVASCARLPLALAIAAARAALQPHYPLGTIAAGLREAQNRLDALASDDQTTDVRAVFSWTYHTLRPEAARLFRLIGLHPGPDISASAVASAAGVPLLTVQTALAELTHVHLLTAPAPGQYSVHDLLRAYAIEQAHRYDTEQDRAAASRRILDHYLHTAFAAARLLDPHRDPIKLEPPRPGTVTEDLTDRDHAIGWFTAHRGVLLSLIPLSMDADLPRHTIRLAWSIADFLGRRGRWQDLVTAQAAALRAARRTGDRTDLALAHKEIAIVYIRLARYDDAHAHLDHALALYEELGDHAGQAHIHQNIARTHERQGRNKEALSHSDQALDLYRLAGHRHGEAVTLNAIGWRQAHLGEYQQALRYCEQALVLLDELGDRFGLAGTWDSLGYAHRHLGHHDQAVTCYQHAVRLLREVGDRHGEADSLNFLGDLNLARGAIDAARDAWGQALDILDDLGHPDADTVLDKLRSLDSHPAD
jgi:tetratricopeptide (TPR) repeat protein